MSEAWNTEWTAAECTTAARDVKGHFLPGTAPGPGRPSKYRPEYAEQARKLAQLGATVAEIADFFGVADRTIRFWQRAHPEFEHAIQLGREPANRRTERSLYELANGYDYEEEEAIKIKVGDAERIEIVTLRKHRPPDVGAISFFLSNRDPANWKHRRDQQHSGMIQHVPNLAEARRQLAEFIRAESIPLRGGGS